MSAQADKSMDEKLTIFSLFWHFVFWKTINRKNWQFSQLIRYILERFELNLLFLDKNCLQDMGLNDGSLTKDQIEVTSVFNNQNQKYGKSSILLNSQSGWKPSTNSMQEYITVSSFTF